MEQFQVTKSETYRILEYKGNLDALSFSAKELVLTKLIKSRGFQVLFVLSACSLERLRDKFRKTSTMNSCVTASEKIPLKCNWIVCFSLLSLLFNKINLILI